MKVVIQSDPNVLIQQTFKISISIRQRIRSIVACRSSLQVNLNTRGQMSYHRCLGTLWDCTWNVEYRSGFHIQGCIHACDKVSSMKVYQNDSWDCKFLCWGEVMQNVITQTGPVFTRMRSNIETSWGKCYCLPLTRESWAMSHLLKITGWPSDVRRRLHLEANWSCISLS